MNSIDLEIKARSADKVKGRSLPWLNQWQYGRELWGDQDFAAMLDNYKSWVYVCASRNATAVANVPLRLYVAKDKKGQKLKGYPTRKVEKKQDAFIRENPFLSNIPSVRKAAEYEELTDHPFLDLQRSVNPWMNNFDLMETIQLYQELCGNAFLYIKEDKMGIPREIWTIPPQNCKIIPDREKFISGYKYIKGNEEILLDTKSVIHFKMTNPKSVYYGVAPFVSVAEEFNLNRKINEYETAMFSNMGTLSGLFETESSLSEHEFERLKIEIQQSFTGTRNTGKMPLLDNGLKYKPLGANPREMSFLGGREHIKECVLNAYGQALGMYSAEANRANVDGAIYLYSKSTVQPRLKRLEEKLNEALIWRYDEKLFVAFDNPVPEDKEFELNKMVKETQGGLTTINEARIELGKKPHDSRFDEPILPLNMTIMDEILKRISEGTGDGNVIDNPEKMLSLLK